MLVYIVRITKRNNTENTNRGRIQGLQIGAREITNRCSFRDFKKITYRGRDFKSGQRDFKLEQKLQIGAREITDRGRDSKSVQNKCKQNSLMR